MTSHQQEAATTQPASTAPSSSSTSTFSHLNYDCLTSIMTYLTLHEVASRFRFLNMITKEVAESDAFWELLFKRDAGPYERREMKCLLELVRLRKEQLAGGAGRSSTSSVLSTMSLPMWLRPSATCRNDANASSTADAENPAVLLAPDMQLDPRVRWMIRRILRSVPVAVGSTTASNADGVDGFDFDSMMLQDSVVNWFGAYNTLIRPSARFRTVCLRNAMTRSVPCHVPTVQLSTACHDDRYMLLTAANENEKEAALGVPLPPAIHPVSLNCADDENEFTTDDKRNDNDDGDDDGPDVETTHGEKVGLFGRFDSVITLPHPTAVKLDIVTPMISTLQNGKNAAVLLMGPNAVGKTRFVFRNLGSKAPVHSSKDALLDLICDALFEAFPHLSDTTPSTLGDGKGVSMQMYQYDGEVYDLCLVDGRPVPSTKISLTPDPENGGDPLLSLPSVKWIPSNHSALDVVRSVSRCILRGVKNPVATMNPCARSRWVFLTLKFKVGDSVRKLTIIDSCWPEKFSKLAVGKPEQQLSTGFAALTTALTEMSVSHLPRGAPKVQPSPSVKKPISAKTVPSSTTVANPVTRTRAAANVTIGAAKVTKPPSTTKAAPTPTATRPTTLQQQSRTAIFRKHRLTTLLAPYLGGVNTCDTTIIGFTLPLNLPEDVKRTLELLQLASKVQK